jgi:ribosomal protein S18 acetylase RimI-like enzyme
MDVIHLATDRWKEYRDLRLRALKEDPEAFSSSYADSLKQPDEFWKKRLAEAAAGKRAWLLFAGQDDKLLGMLGAYLEPESADMATIVSVYVVREARGRGISALLMAEILLMLSSAPALRKAQLRVNVTQLAAIQLYRRFGFREIGVEPSTTGAGQAVQQLVMQRNLPVQGLN